MALFFQAYITFYPHLANQLAEYQIYIARIAKNFSFKFWYAYDQAFRLSISNNPSARWDVTNTDILTTKLPVVSGFIFRLPVLRAPLSVIYPAQPQVPQVRTVDQATVCALVLPPQPVVRPFLTPSSHSQQPCRPSFAGISLSLLHFKLWTHSMLCQVQSKPPSLRLP